MKKIISLIFSKYGFSFLVIILEILAIIAICFVIGHFFWYFWIFAYVTSLVCVLAIINSETNPDYKVPWLVVVLMFAPFGALLWSMFYSKKPNRREIKKVEEIKNNNIIPNKNDNLEILKKVNIEAYGKAKSIMLESRSTLFNNSSTKYYKSGELMMKDMLESLNSAKHYIFIYYFIIEEGIFWNSILEILKEKVKQNVEVRVMYDDIGCMRTLPRNYKKKLKEFGIKAVVFNKIVPKADESFNNRSHRKMTIVDGITCYTGGINIADEYINEIEKYGYWKDTGIKLTGEAVNGMVELFLTDWDMNVKEYSEYDKYYQKDTDVINSEEFYIPFGDGPVPIYKDNVAKNAFLNIINSAKEYVYITSPYLIIDSELTNALINSAKRGIRVVIVTPHIPDKKIIFIMTRSSYAQLIDAGVEIYEYAPGFMHAKSLISDDIYGIIGTINFDYRSLVHHYENGVWMYNAKTIFDIKEDIIDAIDLSIKMNKERTRINVFGKLTKFIIKLFAPLF